MKTGDTELEIDPWCSRWDAILFIVLIISEYIVRSRHAAPRSRIREIYAIGTTPSPPPPPPLHSSCLWFVPPPRGPFFSTRPKYADVRVDAHNLYAIRANESRIRDREFRLVRNLTARRHDSPFPTSLRRDRNESRVLSSRVNQQKCF